MSTIRNILTNEKYKGDCLLQKGYTADFLTKKRKTNNGELPQYYIEDDHKSIIDKETFDAVQVMTKSRDSSYSGKNILSNKNIRAECGSAFGRKVWHSNDKYRRVIYRCNKKFENGCKSMTVDEEMIKSVFVEKYNQINRKEYLKNAEEIIKVLDVKDEKIDILREKIKNIVNRINELVDRNATVKMDQEEYRKKHEKLIKEYEKLKAELDTKENEYNDNQNRIKEIKSYVATLRKCNKINEFSEELFAMLVDKVVVSDNEIKIRWRDGREA